MTRRVPSLSAVLTAAARVEAADIWVSLPARIEKYDAARQTVTAQPLLRQRRISEEDGEPVSERLAPIVDVPVVYQCSRRGGLTIPLEVGDEVLVVFVSGSIDLWKAHGREADATDDRRNHVSSAFAIPCVLSPAGVTDPASTVAVVVRGEDVRIGSKNADAEILIKEAITRFKAALYTALDAAVISLGAGGAATIKALLDAALALGGPWPNVAEKVKVE